MDHQTEQEAAVAAVEQAQAAANVARALAVFDVIDAQASHLTAMDRLDFAYSTWQTFADIDVSLSDEQIATVLIRAAGHIPEETFIDLAEIHFAERAVRVALPGDQGVQWVPEDGVVILTAPVAGGLCDIVLSRPLRRSA